MNIERLKMLSDLLRRPVPVEGVVGFDMGDWSYDETVAYLASSGRQIFGAPLPDTCGTTCCAMGLAGMSPEFRALGLVHDPKWSEDDNDGFPFIVDGEPESGLNAAEKFFGIDWNTAYCLFGGSSWYLDTGRVRGDRKVRATDVADAIDHLLEHGTLPVEEAA